MCGIVGYFGNKKAAEVLVEGLSKLEYRVTIQLELLLLKMEM
jgi:hypothetical protein